MTDPELTLRLANLEHGQTVLARLVSRLAEQMAEREADAAIDRVWRAVCEAEKSRAE